MLLESMLRYKREEWINNINKGERLWLAGYAVNAVIPRKQTHHRKNALPAKVIARLWIIPATPLIVQENPMILKSRGLKNKGIRKKEGYK